jgi:hypothetical protein
MFLCGRVWKFFLFINLLGLAVGCQSSVSSQSIQDLTGEPPTTNIAVTRIVSDEIIPSPTPFTCTALPDGMTIELIPLSSTLVEIEVQGLQSGEEITTVFTANVPGRNKVIKNPGIVVGADGHYTSQEILRPISEESENHWKVAVIHSRGVACAEVTLPDGSN